jgi:hypothetical protein
LWIFANESCAQHVFKLGRVGGLMDDGFPPRGPRIPYIDLWGLLLHPAGAGAEAEV